MKSFRVLLLIFFLLLLLLASVNSTAAPRLVGGWSPIKDLGDPHVREIGEFAVSEHDKGEKGNLVFSKVVRGETQVVSGINYRLVVEAKDGGGAAADYEVVVWEKAWLGFRELTSFKSVG